MEDKERVGFVDVIGLMEMDRIGQALQPTNMSLCKADLLAPFCTKVEKAGIAQ